MLNSLLPEIVWVTFEIFGPPTLEHSLTLSLYLLSYIGPTPPDLALDQNHLLFFSSFLQGGLSLG